jgi:hypothetical protein
MDSYTYLEEEHWRIMGTLAHMLRSVWPRKRCDKQLEYECLA